MTISTTTTDALLDQFASRLAAVGGNASRLADSGAAAGAIAAIAEGLPGRTVWVSDVLVSRAPDLVAALRGRGFETEVPESPAAVRDQPLGLAIAEGAIAETGSAIMSEPRIHARSVTLMTETLVVICPTSMLLPSLDEAASVLRAISTGGASYATFVTGPSRTADIERQLTVGVQGPSALYVVLVDDLR